MRRAAGRTGHHGRQVIVGIATVVLTTATLASSSYGARDITQACPADTPEDGFTDTGEEGSPTELAVDCLVSYGVTVGTSATTYSPVEAVRREQMASFLVRLLATAEGFTPPPTSSPPFDDVEGSVHRDAIAALASLDITLGTAARQFSPTAPVQRGAMASFIVRVLEQLSSDLPVVTFDEFDDDEDSVHEDAINVLAELDIADGVAEARFDPQQSVTRQQMALFLARTLDHLIEDEGLVMTPNG